MIPDEELPRDQVTEEREETVIIQRKQVIKEILQVTIEEESPYEIGTATGFIIGIVAVVIVLSVAIVSYLCV